MTTRDKPQCDISSSPDRSPAEPPAADQTPVRHMVPRRTLLRGVIPRRDRTAPSQGSLGPLFEGAGGVGVGGVAGIGAAGLLAPSARADDVPADVDPGAQIVRLLRRITYGITPVEFDRAVALGFEGFLEEQLNPDSLDDSVFDQQFARLHPQPEVQNFSFADLYQRDNEYDVRLEIVDSTLLRAIYSRKQLFERMVEFWHDHFNMDYNISFGGYYQAVRDRDVTRRRALGTFHDLLLAQSSDTGMLTFLTNVTNMAEHPNENFARELMELHTLGVNAGYTQRDVEDVARCFTGWSTVIHNDPVEGGQFRFIAEEHDSDEKLILGNMIPAGGGIEDGLQVLRILADHPATAAHISRKLAAWFLGEPPRESLVQDAARRYRQTGGNIREVLRAILTPNNLHAAPVKLKRPFHFVVSGVRALETHILDEWFLRAAMRECGHPIFEWGPPNGFPDTIQYWGGGQMARWCYGCTLGENQILDLQTDASRFYEGLTTAEQVIEEMNRRFFQNEMPATDRQLLLDFLSIEPDTPRHRNATTGLLLAMQGFQWY